jgi:Zn-dependent protease with chaperone function
MTLNFDDFISNFWLAVAILLAILFLLLWIGDFMRAAMWKQRCKQTEVERDDFAKKYFDLREAQLSEIRMRARLETARETRLARNLERVLTEAPLSYLVDGPVVPKKSKKDISENE